MNPPRPLTHLRKLLHLMLGNGMSDDPLTHAEQVAEIAGILDEAFRPDGFEITLVGGSAIEIQ